MMMMMIIIIIIIITIDFQMAHNGMQLQPRKPRPAR